MSFPLNNEKKLLSVAVLAILTVFLPIFIQTTFAQVTGSIPLAVYFPIADPEAGPGDIISQSDTGLIRSKVPYDKNIFGVIVKTPLLSFNKQQTGKLPVVSYGEAYVKVSNINGQITKGSFITSSSKSGVGQKSSQPGFVLGRALEDLEGDEGIIRVLVNPQYIEEIPNLTKKLTLGNVLAKIAETLITGIQNPENFPVVLRYVLASLIGAGSFLLGFLSFIRSLQNGIEATGRNPLAKRDIQITMVINLIGIFIVTLAGISLAVLVIVW